MKVAECKRCGSKELIEKDGFLICVYCQSRYLPQEGDIPKPATEINISSDIQDLLQKCRDDPNNSRRYANLILDIDPTNNEAKRYLK